MPASLVLGTLKHVWSTLEPLKLQMAVMGGIAMANWQYFRATRDVDLLIALGKTDLDRILKALLKGSIRPKHQPPVATLGSLQIVQMQYEPPGAFVEVQVDLLLADAPYHRKALQRRVSVRLPDLDFEVFVLACEDLILHKLLAGRIIDRADVIALVRLNRPGLELPYLLKWAEALQLKAELTAVWQEAFPGELFPDR